MHIMSIYCCVYIYILYIWSPPLLFYTIIYHTILCHTILYCTILYFAIYYILY